MDELKGFELNINGRLDVYWDDAIYKSTIQDVSDDYFAMSVPMFEGRYLPLERGEKVEIIYYDNLVLYKFIGVVINRKIDNNVPQLILNFPDKVQRIQRRNYVRVDLIEYINYCKFIDNKRVEDLYYEDEKNLFKAILLDISGGGMKLKIKEKITASDILLIQLPTNEGVLRIKGRVVRVFKDDDGRNICGICFIEIDNKTRERIIRHVFDIMRKQRNAALKEG